MQCVLLNAPDPFVPALQPLPAGAEIVDDLDAPAPYVHAFALNTDQLRVVLPEALKRVAYDGLLWISWPKASADVETDLDRELLTEGLGELGYRAVRSVSVSDVWSALRFRPKDAVGA